MCRAVCVSHNSFTYSTVRESRESSVIQEFLLQRTCPSGSAMIAADSNWCNTLHINMA